MATVVRKLRQRFGIAARPMKVKTHLGLHWQLLGFGLVLALGVAAGLWLYDAGRQYIGLDEQVSIEELKQLRARIDELDRESAKLRSIAETSEASIKIERTAQAQLAQQLKIVEAENARLKEDLAFFENLVPGSGAEDKLTIHGFRVTPDALPGEYRFRLLLTQGGTKRDAEFKGRVQLVVTLQRDGRNATLTFPESKSADEASYRIEFKRFRRVEGSFRVEPAAKVLSVQVRVIENGGREPRATENFRLT